VAVVVNKMNLVGYSGSHFEEIRRTYDQYLAGLISRIRLRFAESTTPPSQTHPYLTTEAELFRRD